MSVGLYKSIPHNLSHTYIYVTTIIIKTQNYYITRNIPLGTLLPILCPVALYTVFKIQFKRCLLLGRKVMINLDSILKSKDITLPTKVHLVKALAFPVVMYGCESWTIKKAENRRIDAFELWCWRRLLRVPWTVRRSNQSILKEINPEYSLEGLMLKLKLQSFGHMI